MLTMPMSLDFHSPSRLGLQEASRDVLCAKPLNAANPDVPMSHRGEARRPVDAATGWEKLERRPALTSAVDCQSEVQVNRSVNDLLAQNLYVTC